MRDADLLKQWFLEEGRSLPWRNDAAPYAVWISEVMLQQTQVSTVVPYFQKWLKTFPNIESLAQADESSVIKLWEGLGYYSRARSLHKGAKEIMNRFGGELPQSEKELLSLPGIGPYTAAAILSFAFHQKALALDGNVLRVLSRYFGVYGEVTKPCVRLEIHEKGQSLLCSKEPWKSAEALIELGALVCKKTSPVCGACPLRHTCYAKRKALQNELPQVAKRKKTVRLYRAVALVKSGSSILMRSPPKSGIMRGLYEFPFIESSEGKTSPLIVEGWLNTLGFRGVYLGELSEQRHSFTHHRADLFPYIFEVEKRSLKEMPDLFWADENELLGFAFSSGHRRILLHLQSFLETYVH